MSNPSPMAAFVDFNICLKDLGSYSFWFPLPLSAMATGMNPHILQQIFVMGFACTQPPNLRHTHTLFVV